MTEQASDNQGLVPKLRFPEFAGHPLHDYRLGDVTQECKARNKGKFAADLVMGVSKEEGIVPMQARLVADDISRYKILRKDWFAYNPMRLNIGSIGRWQGDREVLVSPDYVVFRCEERGEGPTLRADYLDHFRRSTHWSAFTGEAGDGGVRVRIYYDDIAKVRLILPDADEQQKIADCLSSLDTLIASAADKLAVLRDHKKGLMQQLFTRPERVENGIKLPAETKPRLRFPEFQNAGDWTERPLSELLECPPAYGANAAAVPYDARLPTYLRITDISEDGKFIETEKMSVEVIANESNSMLPNDIALTRTGASVGKAYLHTEANGPLVFAGFLIRVRPNQRHVLSQIVFHYMQTETYWSWVAKTSARSGQPGINGAEYGSLPIPLPPKGPEKELGEQQRIANCLTSLDTLITALADKIDTLKTHKSGLMRQLFPSPAEAMA